jgi:DNA repair protein RecO (recombination protein O)
MTNSNIYQDDVIILRARDWQVADRIAEGFSRAHGRILFIAYGARHVRSRYSASVQTLAHARLQLTTGRKFDTLRQCERLEPLLALADAERLSYASFAAELTSEITPEREPQEAVYLLLRDALKLMSSRNPRLVALSFALKLFALSGAAPSLNECVCCGAVIAGDAYISAVQGGAICAGCRTGAEAAFPFAARQLGNLLAQLDLDGEATFTAKGRDLLILEDFLHKFTFTQVEKPLKSMQFLGGLP